MRRRRKLGAIAAVVAAGLVVGSWGGVLNGGAGSAGPTVSGAALHARTQRGGRPRGTGREQLRG